MTPFQIEAKMSHAREDCFRSYRDHLPRLVPSLPNVSAIEVLEREEGAHTKPHLTRIVNVWHAVSDIPRIARPLVTADMLAWTDYALWNAEDWTCRWRIETHVFQGRVTCGATNTFIDEPDGCRLRVDGQLDLNLEGIPGVTHFASTRLNGFLESFVVKLLKPNLLQVCLGVDAYLSQETHAPR